ncbi:class II fructose-bisphosphate aldolase [Thiomonas sp. FB-6]|uniref:class II fructose-bisphosphate aldolase n=1 Tax=Thiomonas sp. FB-6 TaxID=1158291 RepID=UPI000381E84F|nr:class II fructose-bisphosphate aldolase [Thiomonas sp. FB-6]
MLVTLKELLPDAIQGRYAVPSFNVFGNEEAVAVIAAAEHLGRGVIVACNKDMAEHMGVAGFAGMMRGLAQEASVPVCLHLDHCYEEDVVFAALRAGFTSVMFDGSQMPLQDNISSTARVATVAHAFGATIEGEVGSVPYTEGRDHIRHELTDPQDAARFAEHSGVDAVAVSVGNVHRMTTATSVIDFERLQHIASLTRLPLVIHGTSGIRDADMRRLKTMRVAKFNIGTTMRMTFARSLRQSLAEDDARFDRLTLMKPVVRALQAEATRVMRMLG